MKDNRSFFEKLTGSVRMDDMEDEVVEETKLPGRPQRHEQNGGLLEESEEGELTVDVYQTPTEIDGV